jgi:hypothetical protein
MRTEIPLRPLNPVMHRLYVPLLTDDSSLRVDGRPRYRELVARRSAVAETDVDAIDREIVAITSWYVLRPNEIARDVMRHRGWRSPITIDQASVVIAAIAEAGYDITGNGAPDYSDRRWNGWHPPVRGEERDRVVWSAARYWAEVASRTLTYVSLGDHRGYMPRSVQYDQPGSIHPSQLASLTLGPLSDRGREHGSVGYMRRHYRRLILVGEVER